MRKRFLVMERENIEEPDTPIVNIGSVGLAGYFHVRLLDAETQKEKGSWLFPNVITDVGMDRWGSDLVPNQLKYLAVGTDSTAPSISDTTLGAEVDRTNLAHSIIPYTGSAPMTGVGLYSTSGNSLDWAGGSRTTNTLVTGSGGLLDNPYYRAWVSRTFTDNEGNGNLTELGFFSHANGDPSDRIWNRALFVDDVGTPITVTKTTSDWLHVTYEIRLYISTKFITGSFTIGTGSLTPLSFDYTSSMIAINVKGALGWHIWDYWVDASGTRGFFYIFPWGTETADAYATGTLGSPTSSGAMTGGDRASGLVQQQYVDGNRYLEWRATWEPTEANWNIGIGGILVSWHQNFSGNFAQMIFDPPIMKKSDQTLRLLYRLSWDRVVI